MPTAASAESVTPTGSRAAERNWQANRRPMGDRQPGMVAALDACTEEVSWAIARDGSLWAKDGAGSWLGGCSVPRLAGRALLRSLVVEPGGHCLLSPAHAGLVTATRERIGPVAPLFVVQPDLALCRHILGAEDWADDLTAGRTWFFGGDGWAAELWAALDGHPGLATPTRFVRTRLTTDAEAEPLIIDAQEVFGRVAAARSIELNRLVSTPTTINPARTLVVVGSHFRLWDDHAAALTGALGSAPARYDTDDPLAAAPLTLATAARGCHAVLAANVGRADAADVVPADTRWLTWVTRPFIPARPTDAPDDALIVADPAWIALAQQAGWAADRVAVGAPPPPIVPAPPVAGLCLLADVASLDVPEAVRGYSSQRLLWELIAAELHDDPLQLNEPAAYLASRAQQLGIDPAHINSVAFLRGLLLPAFAQGIARLLLRAAQPFKVWGQGWDDLPEFAERSGGPITSTDNFSTIVRSSTALVRPTPGTHWHPVHAAGRPVLVPSRHTTATLASAAQRLLRGPAGPSGGSQMPTLAEAVAGLLV